MHPWHSPMEYIPKIIIFVLKNKPLLSKSYEYKKTLITCKPILKLITAVLHVKVLEDLERSRRWQTDGFVYEPAVLSADIGRCCKENGRRN